MSLTLRIAAISFFFAGVLAKYSYDPDSADGPSQWASLSLATGVVNQCGGSSNSPIAFNTSSCGTFADYVFQAGNCNVGNFEPVLHENAVEMGYPNASVCTANTLQVPGIAGTYALKQFHIHLSSEHAVNGEYYAAELHLVHQHVDSKALSVVGIPIQPNRQMDHELFAELLSEWKTEYLAVLKACNISSEITSVSRRSLETSSFNAYDLIPQGVSYYTYNGSLTTPPCTEGVWWNFVDKPLLISVRQYEEMSTILLGYRNSTTCEVASNASPSGSTSRPVQPLNGRSVVRVCSKDSATRVTSPSTSAASTILFKASAIFVGIVTATLSVFQLL